MADKHALIVVMVSQYFPCSFVVDKHALIVVMVSQKKYRKCHACIASSKETYMNFRELLTTVIEDGNIFHSPKNREKLML